MALQSGAALWRRVLRVLQGRKPPKFGKAYDTHLRRAFYCSLVYYSAVSVAFFVVTRLFQQPVRHTQDIPGSLGLQFPTPRVCSGHPGPQCALTVTPARARPPDVLDVDRAVISISGRSGHVSATNIEDVEEVLHDYIVEVESPNLDNVILVIAGYHRTELPELRSVWQSLIEHVPSSFSVELDLEVWHDADLEEATTALCGFNLDRFWNGHRLPFSRDLHLTAQRIRQALEIYFVADAPVLVHAPLTHRIILYRAPTRLPCLKSNEPTLINLADLGTLVVLPHDITLTDTVLYLFAVWRKTWGLPELPLCAHLERALPAGTDCRSDADHPVAEWEWLLLQNLATKSLASALETDIEQLKRLESSLWQHEWTPEGTAAMKEFHIGLIDQIPTELPRRLARIKELSLLSRLLLNGATFERRPYLPPSFVGALYGPVVVILSLPLTTAVRHTIQHLKQWRKRRRTDRV